MSRHLYTALENKDDAELALYPPSAGPASSTGGFDERKAKRFIWFSVAAAFALFLFLYICLPRALDPFEEHFKRLAGPSWRLIDVRHADPTLPIYASDSVHAQRMFSTRCAESWIAKGQLCEALRGEVGNLVAGHLDIVYTWVNGTDALLVEWRRRLLEGENVEGTGQPVHKPNAGAAANHFQSHNELLFSLRSTLDVRGVGKRIILSADLPGRNETSRVAQVPAWLSETPAVDVQHHWAAFKTRTAEAWSWRERALPTFNSLAIESQLGHLDTAEAILYMNDDAFVTANLTLSDLTTPLFGPVLRLQPDLHVEGRNHLLPGDNLEGEWPSLAYTNWLLDQRFGKRERPYVAHVSKVFLRPLLRELEGVWEEEFAKTAQSRFRGRQADLHVSFLATHYLIEKHREVLLWSFVMGRRLSRQQTLDLLNEAATHSYNLKPNVVGVSWPYRITTKGDTIAQRLGEAGLPLPGATAFDFSSADGYALIDLDPDRPREQPHSGGGMGGSGIGGRPRPIVQGFDRWPDYRRDDPYKVACHFDIDVCLPASEDRLARFRRLAFEEPRCGDCLIVALLRKTGTTGLEAFLPPVSLAELRVENPQLLGGLAKTWADAVYPDQPSRIDVVRMLQRYSYMIGSSHSRLVMIRTAGGLPVQLGQITAARQSADAMPAFCIFNDDLSVTARQVSSAVVDRTLLLFFQETWPNAAPWERTQKDEQR